MSERAAGCVCTWEQGDSDCPVHVQCSECGADISHQRVVENLRTAQAALLALHAEVERMRAVFDAAVAWRTFDLSRDKHDAYGPLVTRMVEMCTAIDTARQGAEL